ncbi:DUF6268 family outer membrane beta-barrel protein [Cyclobacterium xiamenense]|nr:DUF6268 family outer membrane beta-barrel protein [Cyclobacterium xiamenense]
MYAQDFEFIKIQSAYYPKQTIEETAIDGEIGFFEWGVQVAIPQPIKRNRKTVLIHRIEYGNLRVITEANPTLGGRVKAERYYHSISYNLGLFQSLNPNWRLVVNFAPTLASDLEETLSGDDLLYQANALLINTKNENFKYGLGLAYTTLIGRQLLIPTGFIKYDTRKLELDLVLPSKYSLMFKTHSNLFTYGLRAGLNGGVFNNTTEIQTVSSSIDEVGYSRLVVGPAISWKLKNAINITLQGGMAVGRRLELVDIDGEIIDRTPQAAPYFAVGLSFTPKYKNFEEGQNN